MNGDYWARVHRGKIVEEHLKKTTPSKLVGICYYCERALVRSGNRSLMKTKDHIIPASRGGVNKKINYVDCCGRCNSLKADRTPDEFSNHLLILLETCKLGIYKGRMSPETMTKILEKSRDLTLTIAPYRDTLIYPTKAKKPDWEPVQIPKAVPRKKKEVTPIALKGIDKAALGWYSNWLKTYTDEPEPTFHE